MTTTAHVIVMGVSGCGKSTIAQRVAERLGWLLAEGDDFHPESNIAKMSAGIPLTDDDRWPWLDLITDWTSEQAHKGKSTVVTCSALKRSYRERLSRVPGTTYFIHLAGDRDVLFSRMLARPDHFMPASLLDSQLETLEPLEADELGFVVDVDADAETIANTALSQLHQLGLISPTATN